MEEARYKIPTDANQYLGEFIVFFADEENPIMLFHSPISEEAYKKADEITKGSGRTPIVLRIADNLQTNLIKLLLVR